MKKKVLSIIASVLIILIIAGSVTAYALLPHKLNYNMKSIPYIGSSVKVVSESDDMVTLQKPNTNFSVMYFTDLHLDGDNKTSNLTIQNMIKNIEIDRPNLVIFNGDIITSAFNKKRTEQFCEIFERLGVYWAGGLGNHEGDNKFSISREKMIDIFSSYEHCLIRKGKSNVSGVGNYVLNILNPDNSLLHTFYFLDTGDEMSDELKAKYGIAADASTDDGVKEDQVKWYTEKCKENMKEYGFCESTLVCHIPIYQMKEAVETQEFISGVKLENVCSSSFDSGLFEAVKKNRTTKTLYFGHDHLNTVLLEYEGIKMGYLQPSGYGSYTSASKLGYEVDDWLQGCIYELFETGGSRRTITHINSQRFAESDVYKK